MFFAARKFIHCQCDIPNTHPNVFTKYSRIKIANTDSKS